MTERSSPPGPWKRREFSTALAFAALGATAMPTTSASSRRSAEDAVDHILLGHPNLDTGIKYVFERTGVRAVPSGVHPGRGTRNALAALGRRRYLEVIGLDPEQSVTNPMTAKLRSLARPTLIGWAIGSDDLVALRSAAESAKLQPGEVTPGSRVTPAGKTLEWETLQFGLEIDFLMPFAIRWKNPDDHPSITAPAGLKLSAVWFGHREPTLLEEALEGLGISAKVDQNGTPRIRVKVSCAKGDVELM